MKVRCLALGCLLLSCGSGTTPAPSTAPPAARSASASPSAPASPPASASPSASASAPPAPSALPAVAPSGDPFVVPDRALTELRCFARSEARGLGACFIGTASTKKSGEPSSFKLAFVRLRAGAVVPESVEVAPSAKLTLSASERASIGETLRGFVPWTPTAVDKDGRVTAGNYVFALISVRYDPNGPVVSTVHAQHRDGSNQTLGGTASTFRSLQLRAFVGATPDDVVIEWNVRGLPDADASLSAFSCDGSTCSSPK